ncbi:CDP-diacylglycerol--serine O-phosphatidyltransferase [Arcticibacterium luteifluviistationis]|uniref:CDP-diacylglycerol--serine O-phosphatidyltransferase n=1 Tax=Arcticibacterium luteifluviistationis TaxID=1784714 RepID=A0A2Z4G9T7_9BACT|nr:CDP-diacylglycerol--serine O-phosphatidyltransferase [Arcticibacterium luteifluviistationis]AWV97914.1 CDP-diacylglycerol--serine O-phosphatidyltransferase [Arcticibacterium luteifluviistationis]
MKIFTLPNFITLGNLLCGIYGIIFLHNGQIKEAALLILVALVLDFLDGFVARLTNSYSEIGKQLDSLADMVSFGVLPSLILFFLFKDAGYFQYLSFLPALFSALRLAKFNIDTRQANGFRGLPTPANAMVIASFPFIFDKDLAYLGAEAINTILSVYSIAISFILISDIPMMALKFKSFAWSANKTRYLFLLSSLLLLIILQFEAIPLILALYIALSLLFRASDDAS